MNPVTSSDISPVRKLYDEGLYLQAYRAAERIRPLADWSGAEARVMAGRLAQQLGAPRMAQGHHLLAWREHPDEPEAACYYLQTIIMRRGPYAAWRLTQKLGDLDQAPPKVRAEWYILHALIAGNLRDFDTAETWLGRAEAIAPDNAWLLVARSNVLQWEDRLEEALETGLRALSLWPWYRPAIQVVAEFRTQMGQDEAALELLREANNHLESAAVVFQEIGSLVALERYQEAEDRLGRMVELMPLMEKEGQKLLTGMRANLAYFQNDFEAAIAYGRESGDPFNEKTADNLEDPERRGGQRVSLPLPFVRQHYETCVPATLTTISRFWSKPAEHLEIADQICYNGTTAYHERQWAEQNGWLTREFTVTEKSLATLVDNGIPFTLATITPGNAHMQAAMGYDGRRGTMLIRDPYIRHTIEGLIEEFLKAHGASGPRGMALVPVEAREKLEALELPDEKLWDQLHQFDGALERHRWPEAEQIYQSMAAAFPDHRLTLEARRRLARYDANPVAILEAVDSLLEQFPDDPVLHLARLGSLADLSRQQELLDAYKTLSTPKDSHPVFTQQYAQALSADVRERDHAIQLLHRAIRKWPTEAGSYFILAKILWSQQRFEEALELFRFAICLKDKEERFAQDYFAASRQLGQSDEALGFLKKRWERFGNRSSLTASTLTWAYGQLGRWPESVEVLEQALAQHPEDGNLKLWAAELLTHASRDNLARANELLADARHNVPRRQWLRVAAQLTAVQGDPAGALSLWQKLLEIQPLAIDVHQSIAHLLSMTQNQDVALTHLKDYSVRFPHYFPLHLMLIDWYRELNQRDAYLDTARKLVELAPQNPISFGHLGEGLMLKGKIETSQEAFKKALELNPAYSFAGYRVFDSQMYFNNLKAAAEALKHIETHCAGPLTMARTVKFAIETGDTNRALAELRKLCVTPDNSRWGLDAAVKEMNNNGLGGEALDILDEAVDWPDAIPAVGAFWVQGCAAEEDTEGWRWLLDVISQRLLVKVYPSDCASYLEELITRGAIGERATAGYLFYLVERRQHWVLQDFIERNSHWMRQNAVAWASTVSALINLGKTKAARNWAEDWRKIEGLQPWMLIGPVELFWQAGLMEEAAEAAEQALLLPDDRTTATHRIWLAARAALAGEADKAAGFLSMVELRILDAHARFLYQLTDGIVQISQADPEERSKVFRKVRKQVDSAFLAIKILPKIKPAHRRFYHQSLRFISLKAVNIGANIWYWRRRLDIRNWR